MNLAEIIRVEECPFCELSQYEVGYKNESGATIVFKTGENPNEDWYAILQKRTPADPETGFSIQLMPVGHIESFSELIKNYDLSVNQGLSLTILSYAMNEIIESDAPKQIIYGKCLTPENTQKHLHYKLIPFSGDVAQAFPTDSGWADKEIVKVGGETGVLCGIVKKRDLPTDRYDHVKDELIRICGGKYSSFNR